MAKEKVERTICDRCKKVYEEVDVAASKGINSTKPLLCCEVSGLDVEVEQIEFDDLCPKCKTRVAGLIKQMVLESDSEDESEPAKKEKTTKKEKVEKKAEKNGLPDNVGIVPM